MSTPGLGSFDLHDIFTRIAPGTVFVSGILLTTVPTNTLLGISGSNLYLLLFLLASYLVGEYLHIFRRVIQPVPTTFKRILYAETDDERRLNWRTKLWMKLGNIPGFPEPDPSLYSIFTSSEIEFTDSLENNSSVDTKFSSRDIYRVFVNLASRGATPETDRMRTLYLFNQNMIFAISATIVLFPLIHYFEGLVQPEFAIIYAMFGILSILLLVPVGITLDQVYIDYMITDYFAEYEK